MNQELFSVKDKVVIVTGGLGQLGRQYCSALVSGGAKVAVFDLWPEGRDVGSILESIGGKDNIIAERVDIVSRPSIEEGLIKVEETWGAPVALINNAALDSPPNAPAEETGPFETYPEESWDKVMDVNLKGTFLCCQVIGGRMAEAGRGSIINVSSIYGNVSPDQRIYEYRAVEGAPFFKPVAYSASKSGLLNLTRYLATYWAKKNVRVNCVTLGGVFNNQDEEFLKGYCAKVPLGRMANQDEYNGLMIFLISEASSYVTGSNLIADGGWTAW